MEKLYHIVDTFTVVPGLDLHSRVCELEKELKQAIKRIRILEQELERTLLETRQR